MQLRTLFVVLLSLVAHSAAFTTQGNQSSVTACSLMLVGYSSTNPSRSGSSSATSTPRTPGVAYASLRCTASGNPRNVVSVAINETYLGWHAARFTGVNVVAGSSCPQQAVGAAAYPLLQFCGNHSVRLVQPVIERVWLQSLEDGGWSGAVVAFGSAVTAGIFGGRFTGNVATHVLLTRDCTSVCV